MTAAIHCGDCRTVLAGLPAGIARTCVTSPPYFGLRDYGVSGQIGLESTVEEYVGELVAVFREVRRVLADDGTLWLNLGDTYASDTKGSGGGGERSGLGIGADGKKRRSEGSPERWVKRSQFAPIKINHGLKPKDLIGIPWRVAFALQADGWYLRQDIVWHKPNPMPESVTDRCTKSHEYLFLLSKRPRYYYNAAAIAEPVTESTVARLSQSTLDQQAGSDRVPGKTNGPMKAVGPRFGGAKYGDLDAEEHRTKSGNVYEIGDGRRNKRSVWTVATQPFSDAHFATFPPKLIEPCILAGSEAGDTVLDPFTGAGTTGLVADRLNRDFLGIELNPDYAEMARRRITNDAPLFASVEVLA